MPAKEIAKLAVFEGREIRKTIHNDEWWFSVADVVETLTDSVDTRQYIKRMRQRDPELDSYWGTICTPLELLAPDGKRRQTEYAILTNEIMQGAFDLKVDEDKEVKGLERENLRDHMTDIELILAMLAEATTTTLHRDRDSQGFDPLKKDAQDGGAVAGRTSMDIEQQIGKPVISQENFKEITTPRRRKLTK